jgi:hypothetical protein
VPRRALSHLASWLTPSEVAALKDPEGNLVQLLEDLT